MALDQDGHELGFWPVRNVEGEPIGEITRVSFFEDTTGEALIEMRIDGDVARQGYGFTGSCAARIKIWEDERQVAGSTEAPEPTEGLRQFVHRLVEDLKESREQKD